MTRTIRIIPRLDVKSEMVIKGIHLEGLRKIAAPNQLAVAYYSQGADELLYMDVVASLYGRNTLDAIIERTAEDVFIPITVGGGVRSVADATRLLRCGADKIAINTAALNNPGLISDIAGRFGTQCVVLSVEAKRTSAGRWEAYTENGRQRTGVDVISWVRQAVALGAGEILVTSVDQEGTRKGFDLDLIAAVGEQSEVPIIASGGFGSAPHAIEADHRGADAIAIADWFHYGRGTVADLRDAMKQRGVPVRAGAFI